MSLRLRLILSYAALLGALGFAAWWGVQRLTADLTEALGETAASVGRSVVTVLRDADRGALQDPTAPHVRRPNADSDTNGAVGDALQRRELRVERRLTTDADGAPREDLRVLVDGREVPRDMLGAETAMLQDMLDVNVRRLQGEPAMLLLRGAGIERAIPLPRLHVDEALESFTRRLGLGIALLFGAGLLLSVWIAQRIARPLRALAISAQALGRGALGTQAREDGAPEVRQTIAAFNRMSAQLQRLDAEAAELRADRELAELGEIGRGLAHSLRNPLHALGLSLDALADRAGDDATAHALARSGREQLQRVDQALRGFLALAAGTGVAPQPTVLRDVVDDVLLEAVQRAQGRVAFACEGDHVVLDAVPAELRVMLHALIVNALEASPDGGRVAVHLHGDGDTTVVTVSDEGNGVDPALRPRLFQPHVSGKPHGAGMGLFLAQRLATLRYRGGITLEPGTPRGTVARLVLRGRAGAPADMT